MAKTKNIYDEKDVQKGIGKIMRDHGVLYYHREKYNKTKSGDRYTFNGMPDTIVWLPHGKVITIEIKKEKEVLRPKQLEWSEYLLNNSHDCYIIQLEDTTHQDFLSCIITFKCLLRSYGVPVE